MDLSLDEGQVLLRDNARRFLRQECPSSVVRQMEKDPRGYDPALWKRMADLGWLGLHLPEKYGGDGSDFLTLCVLVEEMGAVLLPVPFMATAILGALPVALAGTPAQQERLLPPVARGELLLTAAWAEVGGDTDPASLTAFARNHGDGFVLEGTKLLVPYAHVAHIALCLVQTHRPSSPWEPGLSLFLVDLHSPGVTVTPMNNLGGLPLSAVEFHTVAVGQEALVGEINGGWSLFQTVLHHAATASCAEITGAMQHLVDMTTAYAKDRIQFGRPIGSFQPVQHRCVDMLLDAEAARVLTHEAAWRLSQGLDAAQQVAMARAFVIEASSRVVIHGHQIHGALGYTWEHDMQLYSRRLRVAEALYGEADYYYDIVAQELGVGGTPRSHVDDD